MMNRDEITDQVALTTGMPFSVKFECVVESLYFYQEAGSFSRRDLVNDFASVFTSKTIDRALMAMEAAGMITCVMTRLTGTKSSGSAFKVNDSSCWHAIDETLKENRKKRQHRGTQKKVSEILQLVNYKMPEQQLDMVQEPEIKTMQAPKKTKRKSISRRSRPLLVPAPQLMLI